IKALIERPSTEGEAAAAMAALQKLMLKHNLTQFDIDAAGQEQGNGYLHEEFNLGTTMSWRKHLINAIARATFCDVVFPPKGATRFLIGEEHNLIVVREMYEYLVEAVMRLADEEWSAIPADERAGYRIRAWK